MGNDLLASFDSALCPYETTLNEGHGFSRAVNGGVDEGFIDDCKTNVQVSLFRANFEKCFVSGHDFSRAEMGQ